jgi:hypothetical protein
MCSLRPAIRLISFIAVSAALAGCGGLDMPRMSEVNFFPNRGQLFKTPDWGSSTPRTAPDTISSGPVAPEQEVDAAGRCAAGAAAPTEVSVGTVAGDLGTTAAVSPEVPGLVPGGVALGMTECQVVSHAGQPGQVTIGVDEAGQRKVVLTYLSGPWPGIYTFAAGRLKVVDRVAQPEQPKASRKKARGARR